MNKRESGNIVDEMGSILIVAFIFAMILALAAYGSLTQKRLRIDQVAKEYLYRMEESGFLSDDEKNMLVSDLQDVGCIDIEVIDTGDDSPTTTTQAVYGDKVVLHFKVSFENPLYTVFSIDNENASYRVKVFNPKLYYEVVMSTTSKW